MRRCGWPGDDPLMVKYHDTEWGVPVHDDRKLFEFLVLDAFQAGLSWAIVLHKREAFRKAFAGFDPQKVARFTERRMERLRADAGIIRNRLKIKATVSSARAFGDIQREFGSFDEYIWQFTGGGVKVKAASSRTGSRTTSSNQSSISGSPSITVTRETIRTGN